MGPDLLKIRCRKMDHSFWQRSRKIKNRIVIYFGLQDEQGAETWQAICYPTCLQQQSYLAYEVFVGKTLDFKRSTFEDSQEILDITEILARFYQMKQGCSNNSRQDNLQPGSRTIIFLRKSNSISFMCFSTRLHPSATDYILSDTSPYRTLGLFTRAMSVPKIVTMLLNCSSQLFALKSRLPVCMKQKMHPRAHMSIFWSQRFSPRSSSGARQQRVPTWLVMSRFYHACQRDIPKSMSLSSQVSGLIQRGSAKGPPLHANMMLAGFKSRWMISWECRESTASTNS